MNFSKETGKRPGFDWVPVDGLKPAPGISLLMIATLLGCIELARYVMTDDIGYEEFCAQLDSSIMDELNEYCTSWNDLQINIMDAAAMSKNTAFIDYLIDELDWEGESTELAAFYIEQKDFNGLKKVTKKNKFNSLNAPVRLEADYFNFAIPNAGSALSLLGMAVANKWPAAIKLLIDRGASLNNQWNPDGIPTLIPLNVAINLGYYDMAAYLFKLGANPNVIDNDRYSENKGDELEPSPLTCAIHKGRLDFIKLLFQNKVSLTNETRNQGENYSFPLIIAIYSNHLNIAASIIKVIGVETALAQLSSEQKKKKEQPENPSNLYKLWKLQEISNDLMKTNPVLKIKYLK